MRKTPRYILATVIGSAALGPFLAKALAFTLVTMCIGGTREIKVPSTQVQKYQDTFGAQPGPCPSTGV